MEIAPFRKKNKSVCVFIDIGDLAPNPMQPRTRFCEEELELLASSIRQYGVLQPLAVRKREPLPYPMPPGAKYEIIAGERRWRAARMAGLAKVPCVILNADSGDSAAMALVENIQRSDLSFFEEAAAIRNLLLLTGKTQGEAAKMLSVSQPTLSNKLRLLKLSERERLLIEENKLSERHARALIRIDDERDRRSALLRVINGGLSAPETEALAEAVISRPAGEYFESLRTGRTNGAARSGVREQTARKGVLKDIRPLYNTIEKAVRFLNEAGRSARWEKLDSETEYTVTIHIAR
ncbi:MAG: ParB/RepB/Spo0J family partition protein [Clostridia bacterium]|nr:ParB/RepB/Spo0J family partition protein [Clostridia bacterium]